MAGLFDDLPPLEAYREGSKMTAEALARSIFSRPQAKLPGNERIITRAQLDYFRALLREEDPASIVEVHNTLTWMPKGRDKYVLKEDIGGTRHTLTRLSNLAVSPEGKLFA